MPEGRSAIPKRRKWWNRYVFHPCMFCSQGLTGMVQTRMLRSVPGKPFHPEASSLHVDWLPALFAHTEEYPRPWALPVSLHTQGR